MFVRVLAMFVSRRRMLLGLVMLAMRMMVGSLEVVVSSRMMASGGQVMMLDRGVFGVFGHGASSSKVDGKVERNVNHIASAAQGSKPAHPAKDVGLPRRETTTGPRIPERALDRSRNRLCQARNFLAGQELLFDLPRVQHGPTRIQVLRVRSGNLN
jgi:hypothetical protein